MIEFTLRPSPDSEEPFIELNKLLKATQVAESGSMANMLISTGKIWVNGKIDTRKRAKIRKGDKITYETVTIEVH
jgi:ribosome-associated protein